jgi:RHS repeat-associated protein
MGTPAESKPGQSTTGTYARDKIETVNLVNGNFSLAIPLATVGGRGDASFTITLSYNSKVWSSQQDREPVVLENGAEGTPLSHYSAMYEKEITEYEPGVAKLGGGWSIRITPGMKGKLIGIEHMPTSGCNFYVDDMRDCGFRYALSKMWLSLPDGSQVEMRDVLTQGAPSLITNIQNGYHVLTDRDRGRVWRSVDGSNIIFVRDAESELNFIDNETFTASGWVFLPNGSRMRMDTYGMASKLIDRNGNFINLGPTYTDQLGRQTTVETLNGVVTITEKGYMGVPDRSITINTGAIGDLGNLRADVQSLPRPFTTGDSYHDLQGNYFPHTIQGPHTDLFNDSEGVMAYGSLAGDDVGLRTAVTQLNLLDGRFFKFRYNQYGEVAEIVYPGGGVSRVDYQPTASGTCENSQAIRLNLNRRVSLRSVLKNGVDVDATWRYGVTALTIDGVQRPGVTMEVREGADITGTLLSTENHYFLAMNAEYRFCGGPFSGTGNERWDNAKEFYTVVDSGSGMTVTRRNWEQRTPLVWGNDVNKSYNDYYVHHGQDQAQNDERVTWEETTLDNGKIKRSEFGYDQFNNVTSIKEYDLGDAAYGTLLRQTVRSYLTSLNGYCYSNLDPLDSSCGNSLASNVESIIYQPGLLSYETIHDGSGVPVLANQKARSDFEYDNYSTEPYHGVLAPNSGMIQYDGNRFLGLPTASQPRGNVTKTTRWLNGGADVIAYNKYDYAGQVVWSRDPRGNETSVSYTDNFGNGSNPDSFVQGPNGATFAFPTSTTNAANQTATLQYDYSLGAGTGTKDPNGVINKTEFDSLGRPFRVTAALGLSAQTVSEMSYPSPQANTARVSKQLDATRWIASKTDFDGFDRAITSWRSEDGLHASSASFTIRVNTVYDSLSRVKQVSNPYRPSETSTPVYTTTAYDLSGRVISVTTPDNAVVTTAYHGNRVLVSDQAGKKRISVTDGLGRMAEVWEVTAADSYTEGVSFPGYATVQYGYRVSYQYDSLDNLTKVIQGNQPTRNFSYDTLKRLTSAENPESGTINYKYDENGNLTVKTDARGVSAHYEYDVLNRVTRRWYNGSNSVAATTHNSPALPAGVGVSDEVKYFFDSQALPGGAPTFERGYAIGRLIATTYGGGSSGTYQGYDELGKPLRSIQQTGGINYLTSAVYNAGGAITAMTYPSGHTTATDYDGAGRTRNLTGNLGGGNALTYAGDVDYSPFGGLAKERFGTGTATYHKRHYNIRGQLYDVRVSTTNDDGGWNRGAIVNYYSLQNYGFGLSGPDNSGNLHIQQSWVPTNEDATTYSFMQQNYAYDSLNRITSVAEYINGDAQNMSGSQSFDYDRWGNRTISAATGAGINNKSFSRDANTNRLGVPSGQSGVMSYDLAGNLTADTYSGSAITRAYDAENRMTKETQAAGDAGVYSYDGDGRRVKRNVGGTETWQVYGLGGELIAEYGQNAAYSTPQKEYGYRNGELLITATVTTGWGSPPAFTGPNPLVSGLDIKLENLTELRTAVNSLRSHAGLSQFTFTVDPNPVRNQTTVKADHIRQLRTALEQARAALGLSTGGYAHPTLAEGSSLIYAVDFQELRDQVLSAWSNGGGLDLRWMVSDQLGTPRIILDKTGERANVTRHDYLPFGEELLAGTGGRTTAQGYSASDGLRQKFTDKERDAETGLDYFPARYYASVQGRFTGVDRYDINIERQSIADDERSERTFVQYISQPQQWNRYAYAINNPLKYVDPLGAAIELTGSEEERKKELEELRKAVGKKAGAYLYENKGTDGKYYVGIYTNGPDGKGPAFDKINSVAGEIAPIINDTKIVGMSVVANGTKITDDSGATTTIGSIKDGRTPGLTTQVGGKLMVYFLDPKTDPGKIPGTLMLGTNGKDGTIYSGEILAHELGHARAYMTGDPNNDKASLRVENKVRELYEPKRAIKTTRWIH